jgi:hypothetical protein
MPQPRPQFASGFMTISSRTRKILWARSGNECAFADCKQELIVFGTDGATTVIGEEAHIVAQKRDGPRGDGSPPGGDIDGVANLILVCPTHHRLIDDQPQNFGIEMLAQIKRSHEDSIAKDREKQRPSSNLHPAEHYRGFSDLPIFQSWEFIDTIFVVSQFGEEPIPTGNQSWRGNGLVFEVIRAGKVIYSGMYSEADPDVLFSVDKSLITITEQIFDFKANRDTPFIQRVIDIGGTELSVRSIRLYTPQDMTKRSAGEILASYEEWLANGVDPETAVINIRDFGFANPAEVCSVIKGLFEQRRVDGAVAECASMVANEISAYLKAGFYEET